MTAQTVRAVVVHEHGGPETLQLEQIELPTPRAGQLLVQVESAGVAYADVLMRRGVYPQTPTLPFTPGYDLVGRVVAAGPGCTTSTGTRVAALTVTGSYATHALVDQQLTVPVPDEFSAAALNALILNYVTAYQMLHRVARVPGGGAILVHGAAGGVGTALLELARAHGVRAFGSASGGRTQAVTSRDGVAIDRQEHDVPARVRQLQPGGVDATFDAIGGPHLHRSRRATSRRGTVVSFGISFAVDGDYSRLAALVRHGAALARGSLTTGPKIRLYVIAGGRGYANRHPDRFRADLTALIHLLRTGAVRPETTELALTDAPRAHRLLEAGATTGKLVLLP